MARRSLSHPQFFERAKKRASQPVIQAAGRQSSKQNPQRKLAGNALQNGEHQVSSGGGLKIKGTLRTSAFSRAGYVQLCLTVFESQQLAKFSARAIVDVTNNAPFKFSLRFSPVSRAKTGRSIDPPAPVEEQSTLAAATRCVRTDATPIRNTNHFRKQ